MKYSLRSLMIFVALVAALLGGRIEYLRRGWSYHASEAKRLLANRHLSGNESLRNAAAAMKHATLTARFRYAMRRPWLIVDTTPPELTNDETQWAARDIESSSIAANGYLEELERAP
jgi:hypothetical protein